MALRLMMTLMTPALLLAETLEGSEWLTYGMGEEIPSLAGVELVLGGGESGVGGFAGLEVFLEEKALQVRGVMARKRGEKDGQGITDGNAEVRAEALRVLGEAIGVAGRHGKKLFVGNWVGSIGKMLPFKVENRFVNGMRSLAEVAERQGVTLLISPVNRYERDWMVTAEETLGMLEKVGRPNCKMAFDFFHANVEEAGVEKVLEKELGRIDHLYLCDSNGGVPGAGSLDFSRILQILEAGRYAGTVTMRCRGKVGLRHEEEVEALGNAARFLFEAGWGKKE